jgi:hypothetical protein
MRPERREIWEASDDLGVGSGAGSVGVETEAAPRATGVTEDEGVDPGDTGEGETATGFLRVAFNDRSLSLSIRKSRSHFEPTIFTSNL